jgi:ABC-type multidrug transport system ATPase subunit
LAALSIQKLTKRYSKNEAPALSDYNYEFSEGVYGLLGPNGAGKSTLMNMIVGNEMPTEGKILYEGQEIRRLGGKYRNILGYMPQQQQLYDNFTIGRFLYYFAALKGLRQAEADARIPELLKLVGLYTHENRRLKSLSGGMKQRVLLAQALLNDPKILILDEPTAGLDPKERMNLRNYLFSIAGQKIIILATHVIADVEQIAKEVIFLRKGETVLSGTPVEAVRYAAPSIWETEMPGTLYQDISRKYPSNRVIGEMGEKVSVKIISEEKPEIENVRQAAVSLEDVYMYLYR